MLNSNQQKAIIIPKIDVKACARMILENGSKEEKRRFLGQLKSKVVLKDGKLIVEKAKKK